MFRLLNNIGIRARMLISVSLFIATLFFAMYSAYQSVGANVDFAAQEKLGNYYQQPLSQILYDAGQLRVAVAEKSTEGVDQIVNEINEQMAVLKTAQDVAGEKLQFTDEGLKSRGRENLKYEAVSLKWQSIASSVKSPTPEVEANLVSFIADIRGMISHSGDTSNLILDPDLDSYYLMDVTLLALPQSLDRLAEIGSQVTGQLSMGSASDLGPQPGFSQDDEIQFSVYANLMRSDDIGRIAADFDTSFKEDGNFYGVSPTYKSNVQPLLDDYQAKNKALTDMLDKLATGERVSRSDFHAVWKGALDSAYNLWHESYSQLDIMLDKRIAAYKQQQMKGLEVSFAGIILSMIFYQLVVQSLISPLGALTRTMTDLTNEKLDVEVPYMGVRSEIGKIAAAIEIFKKNALENKRLETEKVELEAKSKREREETMKNLAASFEKRIQSIIDAVSSASNELSTTSKSMGASVSQSNSHALGAANDAQETCANVQSVAAAMEEMSATIQEISSQTQKANEIIAQSMQKVSGADVHANQLRTATQKVRDVINLISGIASQINLLALNATIESARAGEAGKGFSVVASEVRNLAGQTDKSIQEIEKVIADMNDAASSVINALESIKVSVEEINISSCGVASAVEEQSAVVNDIAQNMNSATQKTLMVKDSIQTVGMLSSQAEESSQQILKAVGNLSAQATQLDTAVASFLAELN